MLTTETTLRAIALEDPATIRIFERYHLDYCCGGRRPLAEACAEKDLDATEVLAALEQATLVSDAAERDFTQATPTELVRHIVLTHHAFVRNELPRLLPLAEKVAAKHGPTHPEYFRVESNLRQLGSELIHHLAKEEMILFPYIEALEASRNGTGSAPHACFATVESPIQAMLHEHEAAGALLEEMRAATNDFTPPTDACPTLAGLLHGINDFERDLHRHIHLENNLLFPLAIQMEKMENEAMIAQ
jgi:regulator of cell morphogenesis and NO signaling